MKKILAVCLSLILLFGLCASAEETDGAGRTAEERYEKLIVGTTTVMNGNFFSPLFGNNMSDADVRELIHGLNPVTWDSEYGSFVINESVVTGIQSKLDASGNKTFIIAINENLRFSDGTPVTARDYVFSILLTLSPELRQLGAIPTSAEAIVGAHSYTMGESDVLEGVRVLNDMLFSITIRGEYLPYFYELSLIDYNPLPMSVIAPGCEIVNTGNGVKIANAGAESPEDVPIFTAELLKTTLLDPETGYMSHPSVVTGPYTLTSYDSAASEAVFEANPYYIGDNDGMQPKIKTIVFKYVDAADVLLQLESGALDLMVKCTSGSLIAEGLRLAADEVVKAFNYPRAGLGFISFNCEKTAVSDPAVRQAIAMCLDKAGMVADFTGNYGLAMDGYMGLGQWMYQLIAGTTAPPDGDDPADWEELTLEGLTSYDTDPEGAAALLEKAGWTLKDGDKVRTKLVGDETVALDLTLDVPKGSVGAELPDTELMENMKAAGMNLTVREVAFNELLPMYYRQTKRDSEMILLATNFAPTFDYYYVFNADEIYDGCVNTTSYKDEKLVELAYAMHSAEPGDALGYSKAWIEFQNYFTTVLPLIPVYSNIYFEFGTPLLQNYSASDYVSWADAVYYAYLSDAMPEEEEKLPEGEGEFADEEFFE